VTAVTHPDGDSVSAGVVVGEDMYLALQPLDPHAYATVRRTTPVVAIEVLAEEARGG